MGCTGTSHIAIFYKRIMVSWKRENISDVNDIDHSVHKAQYTVDPMVRLIYIAK